MLLITGLAPTLGELLADVVFRRNTIEHVFIQGKFANLIAQCIVEAGRERPLLVAQGAVERTGKVGFAASALRTYALHDLIEGLSFEQVLAVAVVIEEGKTILWVESDEVVAIENANGLTVE